VQQHQQAVKLAVSHAQPSYTYITSKGQCAKHRAHGEVLMHGVVDALCCHVYCLS
jgi:hypothetical protein